MDIETITLTRQIVSAYVSKNSLPASDLPALIASVHQALKSLGQPQASADAPAELKPAVPVKKSVTPDYIVCLEDGKRCKMPAHKKPAVRAAIRAAGAQPFFLPRYSPDLNPIEIVFAKLKGLLRNAQERTIERLWKRIGELLDRVSPNECANYLKAARYGHSI